MLALAMLELALGSIGVYHAVSYTVGQHRRAMGIRLALGEAPAGLRTLVVGDGLRMVLAGAAAGVAAAAIAAPIVRQMLFGVGAFDPLVYAGVPLLLVAVSTLACWWPARAAARTDVVVALRDE